jgi:hypothetical protein
MTTTYLKAISPHKIVQGVTPKELWNGRKPIVQVFSCDIYVHRPSQTKTKLDSNSTKCSVVSYD